MAQSLEHTLAHFGCTSWLVTGGVDTSETLYYWLGHFFHPIFVDLDIFSWENKQAKGYPGYQGYYSLTHDHGPLAVYGITLKKREFVTSASRLQKSCKQHTESALWVLLCSWPAVKKYGSLAKKRNHKNLQVHACHPPQKSLWLGLGTPPILFLYVLVICDPLLMDILMELFL